MLIVDVGHNTCMSVTNDAENVVASLARDGYLTSAKRLLYLDSDGRKDEILHDGKKFRGFRIL
jgi:hypothetical protein